VFPRGQLLSRLSTVLASLLLPIALEPCRQIPDVVEVTDETCCVDVAGEVICLLAQDPVLRQDIATVILQRAGAMLGRLLLRGFADEPQGQRVIKVI
jgi:hypothetical protein